MTDCDTSRRARVPGRRSRSRRGAHGGPGRGDGRRTSGGGRRGGGRGVLRSLPAPSPEGARILDRRLRRRGRRRRDLVLESIPRGTVRHPDHRLLLQFRSRARARLDLVGEVRHPAGDPVVPGVRGGPLRPSPRHRLLHPRRVRRVGRARPPLAHTHGRRARGALHVLRDGQWLPVPPQSTRDCRARAVPWGELHHQPLAPRGRGLHGQKGRRHRHRVLGHSVHPADRVPGRPVDRLPTHRELLHPRAQRATSGGAAPGPGIRPGRLPRTRPGSPGPACPAR